MNLSEIKGTVKLFEIPGELIWIERWAYLKWKVSLSEIEDELTWSEEIRNEMWAGLKWKVS